MKVYVVSYYDWEDYLHFLLTHDNEYDMIEFEQICKMVKEEAYANCLESIKEFNRGHSWDRNLTVWDDDLTFELVNLLISKYGFKRLDCPVFSVGSDSCKWTNEL